MIADVSLFGMLTDVALVTALFAAAVLGIVHRILRAVGGYRWIWHPPLFHLALFFVLWLAFARSATHFQTYLVNLFG